MEVSLGNGSGQHERHDRALAAASAWRHITKQWWCTGARQTKGSDTAWIGDPTWGSEPTMVARVLTLMQDTFEPSFRTGACAIDWEASSEGWPAQARRQSLAGGLGGTRTHGGAAVGGRAHRQRNRHEWHREILRKIGTGR